MVHTYAYIFIVFLLVRHSITELQGPLDDYQNQNEISNKEIKNDENKKSLFNDRKSSKIVGESNKDDANRKKTHNNDKDKLGNLKDEILNSILNSDKIKTDKLQTRGMAIKKITDVIEKIENMRKSTLKPNEPTPEEIEGSLNTNFFFLFCYLS